MCSFESVNVHALYSFSHLKVVKVNLLVHVVPNLRIILKILSIFYFIPGAFLLGH